MTETRTSDRRPWLAVVLSLFCTGLGHVYAGRVARGLLLFLLSLLFAPVLVGLALLPSGSVVFALVVVTVAAGPLLYVGAAIDAGLQARRHGSDYVPRAYNRAGLYLLFVLVGTLYPAGAALGVRALAFQAFVLPTRSMSPTLRPGDRILVNKLALDRDGPRRGDVVVFRDPETRARNYVKRVIGLPGDRISVEEGRVRLDGEPLPIEGTGDGDGVHSEEIGGRRYRVIPGAPPGAPGDPAEVIVPSGHVFVLGDHRPGSKDSRHFGPVPTADVIGVACWIFWPAESWGRLGGID